MTEAISSNGEACVIPPEELARLQAEHGVGPDSTIARTDRLTAAEQDTGVKLHSRVTIPGSSHGVLQVVGFARVNVPGIDDPIRVVCVADPDHLRQSGPEAVILYTADRLRPVVS